MWETLAQYDADILIFLNSIGIERYDKFWVFVTKIYNWIPLYVLMFVLVFKTYQSKKAIYVVAFVLLTLVITLGFTHIVKETVNRIRPNNEPLIKDVIRILQQPSNFSFWSGHSAVSMALVTYLVLEVKHRFKWVWLFYIWPILFALSRIYVGVHYPGDILVGALMGTFFGWSVFRLSQYVFKKYLREEILSPQEIMQDRKEDPEDSLNKKLI